MFNFTRDAKIALILVSIAVFPGEAIAQQSSDSATATASVTLLQPITLTKTLDLKFGKVVRPTNASTNTVTVSDAGVRTLSGSGNGALIGAVASQAQFTVGGEGQKAITVDVPATFSMGTLTVTTIGNYPAVIGGAFGSQGTATVNVGGSYTLTKTTPTGTYSGTLTVTASYD